MLSYLPEDSWDPNYEPSANVRNGGHAFSDITVDLLGSKLPMTAKRNQYLLTIICNSTGWLHAIPLTNCKTENIADQLLQYFCQVGFPDTIRSDNAGQFRSEILAAVRDRLGIKARFSAPYHPESHGRIITPLGGIKDYHIFFLHCERYRLHHLSLVHTSCCTGARLGGCCHYREERYTVTPGRV